MLKIDQLSALLRSNLPELEFSTDPTETWSYGSDNSRLHSSPDLIAFPSSAAEVAQIISYCYELELPVVARGLGSGTCGAVVPQQHGVMLSTEKLNQILAFSPADRSMVVQPGVSNFQVQTLAASQGLCWPPDPTSSEFCTVGGNLAINSAGPRAVKYGSCRENTLGLKFVDGRGRLVRTGVATTKGVVGYDLTRLLIGSEGGLGFITEATLKLTPLPAVRRTVRASYRELSSATAAVQAIMSQSVIPYSLEFMDHNALAAVREHHTQELLPQAAQAVLLIDVDGELESITANLNAIQKAAHNSGLISCELAADATVAAELWKIRKVLSPSLRHIAERKINEDVVVPISQLKTFITTLDQLAQQYQIKIVNFGHAGNGNLHVNLLFNRDPATEERAAKCLAEVFKLVIELQGSLSGEHGIGLVKKPFVNYELDPIAQDLMREIKKVFDPRNILNPGKFPN